MKKSCRIYSLCLSLIILLTFAGYTDVVSASVSIPETIRIGLYFRETKVHNVNTAVPSFEVSADKGLKLGFVKDGKFTAMYDVAGKNTITIRKDAYFVKTSGGLKEYNPSDKSIPAGERMGPYHIQIGGDFKDLASAKSEAESLKQNGVEAFPVYEGRWQVWTGFLTDEAKVQQEITKLQNKLGDKKLSAVQPKANRIAAFSADGKALALFGSDASYFRIQPNKENSPYTLKVNNSAYRGEIEVRRYSESDLTVINILPFEEYLYGVVPCEIESNSHAEALKAQAVAARTYALNSMGEHDHLGFDLCNTVWCQVYKGYDYEKASTNKAVDDTKGKKITYNGKLAQVFYFSSSGGMTESVENVFSASIPYLVSVEDKYESGTSWKYNWESTFTAEDIKKAMQSQNYNLGDILSVTITKFTPAGRALEVVVKGTKGEKTFSKESTRWMLSNLYSRMYTITTDADAYMKGNDQDTVKAQLGDKKVITSKGIKSVKATNNKITVIGADDVKKSVPAVPTRYTFTGKGNGHAVGMSQEGAKGMANAGFNYVEILQHYFQGTKVE